MIFDYLIKKAMSFKYAFEGIRELWRKENNAKIHMFFTVAVLIMAIVLKISSTEFCIIFLTIGAVWSAEAMNSAVERVVDLVTQEKRPLAKAAKDLAAGAVLIVAISSILIGLVIFIPKIIAFFVPFS